MDCALPVRFLVVPSDRSKTSVAWSPSPGAMSSGEVKNTRLPSEEAPANVAGSLPLAPWETHVGVPPFTRW